MVTPGRRRQAVGVLEDEFGVSQRRACRVVGQHRSTQRHQPKPADDDTLLRAELRDFALRFPRRGWRRAAVHLRRDGWVLNNKRIRWLWREESLGVPQTPKRKRLTGIGTHVGSLCPIAPNVVWAMDFQFDHTIDGRQVKLLNVIDEYTREAISITVEHNIGADDVVAVLERLVIERGRPPVFVRFDNGPEFVSIVVAEWCGQSGVDAIFIDPGSPWQNAWIESFNSRLRDELLNLWIFDSLLEAKVLIEDWRIDYNKNRPHSALGDLTPEEFAQAWNDKHQPQPA